MPETTPPASGQPAPPAPGAAPAQTIVLQPRESYFGRFGKLLFIPLGLMLVALLSLSAGYQSYFSEPNGPQEKYHSLSKKATGKIAIIDVSGAIMEGDDFVKQQIDRVREDDKVRAVVLRVNSPGGTVTYSDYLLHHLRKLRDERGLPMVVSMGSVCASGGYYVSMAVGDEEDTIFAEPTTWTGSIGVVIPHYDLSGALAFFGVKDDSIASGPLKQMGTPTKRMSPAVKKIFQELVDQSFAGFKDVVMSGRPEFRENPEALDEVATGQIFTAKQALDAGLVDKLGFIEDAIARAAELAGVSTDSVRCVRYKKPANPLGQLLGESEAPPRSSPADGLRGLIELSTPRAYYLWSLAPVLVDSSR